MSELKPMKGPYIYCGQKLTSGQPCECGMIWNGEGNFHIATVNRSWGDDKKHPDATMSKKQFEANVRLFGAAWETAEERDLLRVKLFRSEEQLKETLKAKRDLEAELEDMRVERSHFARKIGRDEEKIKDDMAIMVVASSALLGFDGDSQLDKNMRYLGGLLKVASGTRVKLNLSENTVPGVVGSDGFVHSIQTSKNWKTAYEQLSRDMQYYRDLLTKCGGYLGKAAYTADDGSVYDTVLYDKIPELVQEVVIKVETSDARLTEERTRRVELEKVNELCAVKLEKAKEYKEQTAEERKASRDGIALLVGKLKQIQELTKM